MTRKQSRKKLSALEKQGTLELLLNEKWTVNADEVFILHELGRGGFGVVYKAEWRKTIVAVKKLINMTRDPTLDVDFAKEIKLMTSLRSHPNVVTLLGVTSDPLSIILEFLDGGSLYSYLQSGQNIPEARIKAIILGIARGLYHLHKEKIIHRDVAARNVLLTSTCEPKISDFGLSRKIKKEENITYTDTGPIKWMAPECLLERKKYSVKSDVWAFGITVIEIITRKNPYPDMTNEKAAAWVISKRSPIYQIPGNTPSNLVRLLERCFMYDEEPRPELDVIVDELEKQFSDQSGGRSFYESFDPNAAAKYQLV